MYKKILLVLVVYIIVVVLSGAWVQNAQSNLFSSASWLLLVATIVGLIAGVLQGSIKRKKNLRISNGQVERHTVGTVMEHWGTALGIFLLIGSGRMIGFAFTPNHLSSGGMYAKNLHFLGLFFTILFGCYFLGHFITSREQRELMPGIKDIVNGTLRKYLLRFKWKDTGRYLASQKSAFLAFAVIGAGVFISGAIKVFAGIWSVPFETVERATHAHDIFAILFMVLLLIHILFVIAVPSHWRLLASWFTGNVPEDYVKKEKPDWYRELTK
jgi:cytochrome b subunit of formate dehydrogenase